MGTAPDHRCRGYAKAVVSFITEEILEQGRSATITTRDDNYPMQSVAKALGYREMAAEEEAEG